MNAEAVGDAGRGQGAGDDGAEQAAGGEGGVNPFGEWLRTERQRRDWSRAELAEKAGLSHMAIWNIENGHTINPQNATRDKLARALETPVPDAVTREAEK